MILKASKRGGAMDLARHLLKVENEHVEVHQVRGFVSDSLTGALKEAQAVSLGTRCQKFLFHVSLSPPEFESAPVQLFEDAVDLIERQLGLSGQPRAMIFHEKEGRRHAHCVWSRIKVESMTAIDLPHFKRRLMDISKDLYREHGWRMPPGMLDPAMRSPLSFDMAEWFSARRSGKHPRDVKAALHQCWYGSDTVASLRASLEGCGYFLAKGDRRGIVVLGTDGEIHNLARWLGVRSKDVSARVVDDSLPSVKEQAEKIAALVEVKLRGFADKVAEDFARSSKFSDAKRHVMVKAHREEREQLAAAQHDRLVEESKDRTKRFRKGVLGVWDMLTGAHAKLRRNNHAEIATAFKRDQGERDELVQRQLREREGLQMEIVHARRLNVRRITRLLRTGSQDEREVLVSASRARERGVRTLDI